MSRPQLYCRVNRDLDTWPSDYYLTSVTAVAQAYKISRRAARRRIDQYVRHGYLAKWDEEGIKKWKELAPHSCHPQCMICHAAKIPQSGLIPEEGFATITPHIPPNLSSDPL